MLPDKEKQNIEFKSNWRNENLISICAFANTNGGKLYIGVNDKGLPIGIDKSDTLLVDLPNKVNNKLGVIPSVSIRKIKGKEVIILQIEKASVPISYDGKYFIRSGSTNQELKSAELSKFLLTKSGKTWDDVEVPNFKNNDIDIKAVEYFKSLSSNRLPSISKDKNYLTILNKLTLLNDNFYKRACVLLFAKDPQKYFIQAKIKIGKFKSDTDLIMNDVLEGNLFQQTESALDILRSKYLKSSIQYKGIYREEILEYPFDALREGILNAIIHRDYSGTSNILIKVYDNKLTIMNEGSLPNEITIEKLKREHLSKPRNVQIADVFYKAGLIESWGRGTLKIIELCKEAGLPEPEYKYENNVFSVTFFRNEQNQLIKSFETRKIKAIKYISETGKITNQEYQKINNIKRRQATNDLTLMVKQNILKKIGKYGKGIYYIPAKK